MDIVASIKQLLNSDDTPVAIPLDQRRTRAKAAIEAFLRTQTVTQFKLPPDKFAERLRFLVDSPQTLRQGAYGWCLPAAFLHSALRRFPDLVVQFGLDLYRSGEGRLGGIDVKMSDTFRAFDYPEAIRTKRDLPERNRDLYLASHADWLVLAGIQEDTYTLLSVTGEFDQIASLTTGALVSLFEDSGLYAEVTDLSGADKLDRQKLLEALNRSATHDVILVTDMRRFGPEGLSKHAVRLVAPPTVTTSGNSGNPADDEIITFQYWSWGFRPSAAENIPFDPVQNAFTYSQTRRQFGAAIDIVVAEPKPI
jgi:hypothetical protein